MTCLTVHGYVLCFVVATVYYVVSSCCLQSHFRTLVFSYACGVLHVALRSVAPVRCTLLQVWYASISVAVAINRSRSLNQDRFFTYSTGPITDSIIMRLVSIGGVASWLLGVIAVCCTTLHKSKGHILASFQLRPVERPNTAIPRHLPVYSDSDDSRSSSESRTIATSIIIFD